MEFLVVGHVTLDRGPHRPRLGGAVYAALALRGKGRVVLLTRGPEWLPGAMPGGVEVVLRHSQRITEFQISRGGSGRILRLLFRGEDISPADLPDLSGFDAVILDPVIGECDRLLPLVPVEKLSADAQGFVRSAPGGLVVLRRRDPFPARVLHGSPSEIEALGGPHRVSRVVEHLLITSGPGGGTLLAGGRRVKMPKPNFRIEDDTGAGDYLLASYTYHSMLLPPEEAILKALDETWGFLRGRSWTEPPPVPGK